MKTLIENDGCKFALTTSKEPNRHGFGRLGRNGFTGASVGGAVLGASYPHLFCGEVQRPGSPYCEAHHARCCRGDGKDVRALEEMMYAVDESQFRGSTGYAEHTDPLDEEAKKGKAR
jgi:hypothetical protein